MILQIEIDSSDLVVIHNDLVLMLTLLSSHYLVSPFNPFVYVDDSI